MNFAQELRSLQPETRAYLEYMEAKKGVREYASKTRTQSCSWHINAQDEHEIREYANADGLRMLTVDGIENDFGQIQVVFDWSIELVDK